MMKEFPILMASAALTAEWVLARAYLEIDTLQLRWELLLQCLQ